MNATKDVLETLRADDEAKVTETIIEPDVLSYAALSGDFDPMHMDEHYASETIFGKKIAHGMISAGLFSGIFGSKLPRPGSLYISQTLKFLNPVFIGDTDEATAKITRVREKFRWVNFDALCKNLSTGEIALEGQAMIYVLPVSDNI